MTNSLQLPTTAQLQSTTRAIWQHDYGASLQSLCRFLAILIAAAYVLGKAAGAFVHQCNHQLSRLVAQFHEPDWHEQRLIELRQRLASAVAVHETGSGDPQAALPLIDELQTPAKPASSRPASSRPARKRKPAATKPVSTSVSKSRQTDPLESEGRNWREKCTAPGAPHTSPAKGFA